MQFSFIVLYLALMVRNFKPECFISSEGQCNDKATIMLSCKQDVGLCIDGVYDVTAFMKFQSEGALTEASFQ